MEELNLLGRRMKKIAANSSNIQLPNSRAIVGSFRRNTGKLQEQEKKG